MIKLKKFLCIIAFTIMFSLSCESANAQSLTNTGLKGTHYYNGWRPNANSMIGLPLEEPELGWTRYDDQNNKILINGEIIDHIKGTQYHLSGYSALDLKKYSKYENTIKFSFEGDGFRIISKVASSNNPDKFNCEDNYINVYLDNEFIGSYNELQKYTNVGDSRVILEDKTCKSGKHTVKLVQGTPFTTFSLDAVDIKNGELIDTNNPNYQTEKVDNLFKDILQRPSDKAGLDYWTNRALNDGLATVVSGIINSDETRSHHYNNKDLVNILYKSMYGRYADQDGLNYWSNQLDKGYPINSLINQMASNPEFKKNCDKYDFKTSPVSLNDVCEKNPKTTVFIHELYDNILTRKPHTDELRDKVDRIAVRHFAPGEVVKMMFNSDEYKQRNYNNTDFVTMAFRSILGREPDKGGFDYWTNFLKDNSREELVNRFLDSPEYKNMIKSKL